MLVLNLEDTMVEAVTNLACTGEIDVPVDNIYGGCDVFLPESNSSSFMKGTFHTGVRFAIEDETLTIYKFERFAVAASVSFKGQMVSSSVLVAVVKGWL